ncbi:MAG: histidine kinase N-terminal domain-containing protein [Anaerosomatales bacterium]|nr:histidine kinase N-terminal domain-containing protein [Anaerosomatales bacterium]
MDARDLTAALAENERAHARDVVGNLQLVADLGYADVAFSVIGPSGDLMVVADARPMTAVAAVAASRVGQTLSRSAEAEAYAALESRAAVCGARPRTTRGISYTTDAYPVGSPEVFGVVIRDITRQVADAPGKMEVVFMSLAERVLRRLGAGPIPDIDTGEPFTTGRRAGDGVMDVRLDGIVEYASPNAVNIMRMAGTEGGLAGRHAHDLPGGSTAVVPVLGSGGARSVTVEVAGRSLLFRAIDLGDGALALVEDITDVRSREQELRVKEATIREVHHRVKNNLQTVASLLRIQARRSASAESSRALEEAVERVSSMAVVHEMLAASTEEVVDFAAAARVVVDMVRQGLAGANPDLDVSVEGDTGLVPANVATSLALVTAELVHNAIEHGIGPDRAGTVAVSMRRLPDALHLTVRDDGAGLPAGFDPRAQANLGLAIVRTIVEDDLRGSLDFSGARGTVVTIRVPVTGSGEE